MSRLTSFGKKVSKKNHHLIVKMIQMIKKKKVKVIKNVLI